MLDGSILALDVGGGTQDLFIWEPGQTVENAVKMVLPAPTQILARRIARLSAAGRPIFLMGRLMGGGAVNGAVRRHLALGLPLYATSQAALTFSDRLEAVEGWGVVLTEAPPAEAVSLTLGDVDLEALGRVLADFEVPLPRYFAVAVQDHGFAPRESNRRFRFQYWEDFLTCGGRLQDLAYHKPPARFTRMLAVADSLPGAVLMDTCVAGVRGALLDPQAREHLDAGLMVVNLGNAHTFAALVRGQRLWGIYEHHTGLLNQAKLFDHLRRFEKGELTNDEVFADQGHGCAYAADFAGKRPFDFTVITGPQRRLARGGPGVFAAPLGDMMLTGCFGLMEAYLDLENLSVRLAD
ncbi:MAG: DUF1786 domain-containing protein [Deltaproteobacteria bacterium]|nr:DUF1786 domain-containing protein [Deltaproteobacteria bacterium]